MAKDVIEVTQREVEIVEVVERGPVGPAGPQQDINYTVVSSSRTLEAAELIAADTSAGSFTLTLPFEPSEGDAVDIFDFSETFQTNPLTIARNSEKIEGLQENLSANVNGAYFTLIYTGAERGWQVVPRYGVSGDGGGESVLTTQGDMLYRGLGINARLPIGTSGQILKVNSGGNAPEWGAAPATGVTSVGVTGSDGIEVDSGSPVTGSGTIALGVNAASLRSHINVADGANNYTHPNHSGDVTSSGDGATTIANDAVTNAKLANVATATIKGRATAGTGDPEDLTASQVRTILNVADGAEVNVQSNWTEADSGSDAFILNKPTLGGAAALNVGTTTGTVAAGDDARLSDSRTPVSHSASHSAAGSDPVFDQDLNTTDSPTFASVSAVGNVGTLQMDDYGLLWEGVRRWDVEVSTFLTSNSGTVLILPASDASQPIQSHCAIEFAGDDAATNAATTRTNLGLGDAATADIGAGAGEVAEGDHAHGNITNDGKVGSTSGLPLKTGTAGVVEAGAFGTGAGEFAEGNHTHTQLHDKSHSMTDATSHTAGNHKVFYSDGSGQIQELALGNSGEVLTSNGATSAPSFAAASGGIGGGTGSTDNAILRADGTGGSTSQSSDIVIDDATTSTQANVAIVNNHSETNSSIVLTPKGNGAFIVGPKPDGAASVGGNARGEGAIDLQMLRSAATQVASGNRSICIGTRVSATNLASINIGIDSTATNQGSVNIGGLNGGGNTSSGTGSLTIGGFGHSASAAYTACLGGRDNTANAAQATTVGGERNTASATYSLAGGFWAASDRYGIRAHASGRFSASGDAQRIRAVLRNKTTTNSAVELFLDGSSTRLTVPSGKVMAMLINITGTKSDGSAVAHYVRQYCIKNVGGTTSEVYAAVTIGTDNAAGTSITLSANDTNDAVKIECVGVVSETWRWVASVDAVEVVYGS